MTTVLISWRQIHDDISQKKDRKSSAEGFTSATAQTHRGHSPSVPLHELLAGFFLMLKEAFAILFGLNKDESTPSLT